MSFVTLKHQHMRDQWRSQSDLEGKQDCLNYGKVKELRTTLDYKTAKAEALWCKFILEHNLPFSVSDCFSQLASVMFPDSAIASKFACKRTKTAAVITEALAPDEQKRTVQYAQSGPFALTIDESNDMCNEKGCAIVLRVINSDHKCVENRFIDMPVCNRATGANLFQVIDECLRKNEIPWQNVKGFCSDNDAVMVGKRNSVLSRVREATDHQVFDIGCISHIANLGAVALIKCLQEPVEDLLVDTYFWFDKSARKEDYHEFQEFTDTPNEVITKHVSTRWLSMQRCVDRILSQWDALQSYFSSIHEAERPGRAKMHIAVKE